MCSSDLATVIKKHNPGMSDTQLRQDTCGAVTGMFLIISLANSAGDMEKPLATKMDTYAKFREAAEKFREKNRSIYCRDLKNMEGPQPLVCCTQCVEDAAALVDEYFREKQK